jgi:hypothetical protein
LPSSFNSLFSGLLGFPAGESDGVDALDGDFDGIG